MADIEQQKQARSKAKQTVTITARRLHSSVFRGADLDVLQGLMLDLDKAFEEFIIIQEDYELLVSVDDLEQHRVVNGETLDVYKATVTKTYEDALVEFKKAKSSSEKVRKEIKANPLRKSLKRNINRIGNLFKNIEKDLADVTSSRHSLEFDMEELESLESVIMDNLDKLQTVLDLSECTDEADEVDLIVNRVDFYKREIGLMRRQRSVDTTPIKSTTSISRPEFKPPRTTSTFGQTVASGAPYGLAAEQVIRSVPEGPVMSTGYPLGFSSMPRFPLMTSTPHVSASNYVSSLWDPPTSTRTDDLLSGLSHPLANQGLQQNTTYTKTRSGNEVKLKKMTLPTFSGERKDWPEFRAIWKELAEGYYDNKTALAHELKQSVKGEAEQRIKSVYITKPEAYDIMWGKLEAHYNDTSASVQAALDGLDKLKTVGNDDYYGLIKLVDEVEATYCQLEELDQLSTLTMRDVDKISKLLPTHIKFEWIRKYHDLTPSDRIKPFTAFMKFLERERDAVSRLAESQQGKPFNTPKVDGGKTRKAASTHQSSSKDHNEGKSKQPSKKFFKCAFPAHRREGIKHITEQCKEFQKLSLGGKEGKYELLKQVNACFICFGNHRRDKCSNRKICTTCNKKEHHPLLCVEDREDKPAGTPSSSNLGHASVESHVVNSTSLALYPIQQAQVAGTGKQATIFCDGGSNTSYITNKAADRLGIKKLKRFTLDVTTMGNVEKTYDTFQYEICLLTQSGRRVKIIAFGMEKITGPVSSLDISTLSKLFPEYDCNLLQRRCKSVDILIGCDFFGLHPKQEIATAGDNLSIMRGEFGVCLQGTHPKLKEDTRLDTNFVKQVHDTYFRSESFHSSSCSRLSHEEFISPRNCSAALKESSLSLNSCPDLACSTLSCIDNQTTQAIQVNMSATSSRRKLEEQINSFITGEELTTETSPRCGGCRCGKCPTVGHTYSFKEEQELRMIQENLQYDESKRCWITKYPWIIDPVMLPDNYSAALATLRSTERTLLKDPQWADTYKSQIQDMLDRRVARKVDRQELESWTGPKFYISHLAVVNPRSQSTPVRIVFNSSQVFQGVSLNSCLAKGPDCYLNNLIGLLLRWREQPVAVVGDIKKMFNSIHLHLLEQHCHRFLWRDLEGHRNPDVYAIVRVNMGDKPAPAISTEAIYKTAEPFREDSSRAADLLEKSSYVDDLIDSFDNLSTAEKVTQEVENMLDKGGFKVKCWQFSGERDPRMGNQLKTKKSDGQSKMLLKASGDNVRVLGIGWIPDKDIIVYQVSLNFSKKKKGTRVGPNLAKEELPESVPVILTRRMVLEQVMSIYDPLGLVCPFTLLAKVYLRETWTRKLDWDDQLPEDLRAKWIYFFQILFELEDLKLERSLKPADAVGQPWLILLGDGSDLAYGFAAYIRWTLKDGRQWCRLIMAKCRIAPVNKLSTPQMELNAAVLSKRGRVVLEKEMRFEFERVYHFVDSETVLNMLNKTSTRFKVYEGVRIGEIQANTDGDMSCWAWIPGEQNTADWLTRGRTPKQLGLNTEWWNGPDILYQPVDQWGLKFGLQKDVPLPGEKKVCSTTKVMMNIHLIDYHRYSDINKVIRLVAILLKVAKAKSFKIGNSASITPGDLRDAEIYIVKDLQKTLSDELEKSSKKSGIGGRYSRLNPVKDSRGLWIVGQRLQRFNAMTADSGPQKLLPGRHHGTRLFMQRAHQTGHRGRDGTLASFRQHFWVPHGNKLAKSVKNGCQLCKLRDPVILKQSMGLLPEARLKPAPPFNHVMLDLFGPYKVRGEVQKRSTGKAYGVIFTDMTMRAVHIEAVYGYDTSSFLMALSRFASVRGWPEVIYSDPGTQLVGAERELKQAWESISQDDSLKSSGANKGLHWIFGPADSPWHQGAVESLVKSAKRAIHFAVHNQRISVPEFLTVCSEVTNLLNERPIGTLPGDDSDISILTPNSLLLGRSTAKNPGNWQPTGTVSSRYHLVQTITDHFWKKWVELCAPSLIIRQKWATSHRNLKPGDVVIVADHNALRGEYRLALVKEVFPGKDGKVRRVYLTYKNFKVGEKLQHYSGAKDTVISRSVQRLALLVPVDGFSEDPVD